MAMDVYLSVEMLWGKNRWITHIFSAHFGLFNNILLAKKLCDSSFVGQNLDLIHSHFKIDRVISFIF